MMKLKTPYIFISTCLLFFANINAFAGDIVIDGELNDWDIRAQINLPLNLPPYLATGHKVYGKYVTTPAPAYIFAVQSTGPAIGPNTTFWLNTDEDTTTGHQIWGWIGGEEYFINIYSDNKPYLYSGEPYGAFVGGPLEYAYSADGLNLEFIIPAALIGEPDQISLLIDINDAIFLPEDYSGTPYQVSTTQQVLPPRTDSSKRVGIVYSETTKEHFFDHALPIQKAYSQLFMSMQHQAMMAGIPFDLLTEDDLLDVANLVNYDALIFPYFAYVPEEKIEAIHDALYQAVYTYNIGIITAGDWMTNKDDGSPLSGDAYSNMKQMLGIGRVNGEGPVAISLNAETIAHPVMEDYSQDEAVINYDGNRWYNYFAPVTGQNITVLADQTVTGQASGTYPAVLASETGGRNVHFATLEFMGDPNLVWSALQWVIYGDQPAVALKMGRYNNLFVSRNDMDQSLFIDEVFDNDGALLPLLQQWKTDYNFVGSYFINIGNNQAAGEWTDWLYSGPLYRNYIALGNEIGSHSYTHPHDTNILTPAEIEFEFNQSMDEIALNLNPTWRDQNIRGIAVPGAPEGMSTAAEIIQYGDYLTGGYSGIGSGYPSAFGYPTPAMDKVYFSPNMAFDFTLIEFGVPVFDPATGQFVPVPLSTAEAEVYWQDQYAGLMNHASQPIIHWPWHDYGPTTGTWDDPSDPTDNTLYSVAMYTNTIAMAFNDNTEFATSADVAQRISSFKDAKLTVSHDGTVIAATINSPAVGKFALDIDTPAGQLIQHVAGWYAYNDNRVFLDQDGGTYVIQLGTIADQITHITALPMRATLLSIQGNGDELSFSFQGEGTVRVVLSQPENQYQIQGADTVDVIDDNTVELHFTNFAVHNVALTVSSP